MVAALRMREGRPWISWRGSLTPLALECRRSGVRIASLGTADAARCKGKGAARDVDSGIAPKNECTPIWEKMRRQLPYKASSYCYNVRGLGQGSPHTVSPHSAHARLVASNHMTHACASMNDSETQSPVPVVRTHRHGVGSLDRDPHALPRAASPIESHVCAHAGITAASCSSRKRARRGAAAPRSFSSARPRAPP